MQVVDSRKNVLFQEEAELTESREDICIPQWKKKQGFFGTLE